MYNATIRHEPTELIDGSIWGEILFPPAFVSETVQEAAKAYQNLKLRRGLQYKRKHQEGFGPQPKQSKYGKQKGKPSYKIHKLSPQ